MLVLLLCLPFLKVPKPGLSRAAAVQGSAPPSALGRADLSSPWVHGQNTRFASKLDIKLVRFVLSSSFFSPPQTLASMPLFSLGVSEPKFCSARAPLSGGVTHLPELHLLISGAERSGRGVLGPVQLSSGPCLEFAPTARSWERLCRCLHTAGAEVEQN